jgi:hypothetical protein
MNDEYSVEDLLDFLEHASQRGLMPAATATALAVAARNVLGVLEEKERSDLRTLDMDAVTKRFMNKRARDYNPASLRSYASRTKTALDYYFSWRDNPAGFSPRTRTRTPKGTLESTPTVEQMPSGSGYQTSVPIRPGHVVTLVNLPDNLTKGEAERLAQFIRLLALE